METQQTNALTNALNNVMRDMDKKWQREKAMNDYVKTQDFPYIIRLSGQMYFMNPLVSESLRIHPKSEAVSVLTGKKSLIPERVVYLNHVISENHFKICNKRTIKKVKEIDDEVEKLRKKKQRILKKAFTTAKPLTQRVAKKWAEFTNELMIKFGAK